MFLFKIYMQKHSNISFTSDFRFVSYKTYLKLCQRQGNTVVTEMIKPQSAEEIKTSASTDAIIYCLSGVIKNLKTKIQEKIVHIQPKFVGGEKDRNKKNLGEFLKYINGIEQKESLGGFIFGGLNKESPLENSFSVKLFNALKRTIKCSDKNNFTLFLMQDAKVKDSHHWPEISFFRDKTEDTVYLNIAKFKGDKICDVLEPKEIRDHFGYIFASPNDRFFSYGKQISHEFLNKSKNNP